jgi:predicted dienelactone hydrolase
MMPGHPKRRSVIAAVPTLLMSAHAQAASRPADLLQEWQDPGRGPSTPVRVRLPASSSPAPVVIISHGLGGSRAGLAYLGTGLADAGFVAVHLQHRCTDTAVWRDAESIALAMAAAVLDVRNAVDRSTWRAAAAGRPDREQRRTDTLVPCLNQSGRLKQCCNFRRRRGAPSQPLI